MPDPRSGHGCLAIPVSVALHQELRLLEDGCVSGRDHHKVVSEHLEQIRSPDSE